MRRFITRWFKHLIALFLLIPAYAQSLENQEAGLSVGETVDLASMVITEDIKHQSILIEMKLNPGSVSLSCILLHRKPDEWAVFLIDNMDNTPVFVCAEGEAYFYNPFESEILFVEDAGVFFKFGFHTEGVTFLTGVEPLMGRPSIEHEIEIDIHSLFAVYESAGA
jgi:hypothetical protein